jgi:outer membrane protein
VQIFGCGEEKETMLRITTKINPEEATLKLEGKLTGPWVVELENCWHQITSEASNLKIVVDLTSIDFIDSTGKELLARMYRQGSRFLAKGCLTRSIIDEITCKSAGDTKQASQDHKRRKLLSLLFCTASFLMINGATWAEQRPSLRLTLQEAVHTALAQNPQVQLANLTLAQSHRDRDIALSFLLPQAGIETFDSARRYNREALFGQPIQGFSKEAGPYQFFQATTGFSMPIFDLSLWRRWQASKEAIRAGETHELSVREQTLLLVVSQYLSGLRAAANVKAAQSRVGLAQALFDQASDLQKAGVGTGLDTLRANVQLQNEKQRLIVAEAQQQTALFGLARLLNLDPEQNIEQSDEVRFFETEDFPAQPTLEMAFSSRPELQTLRAREMIIQYQKRTASAASLPTISATGSWGYQGLSVASSIPTYQYQVTLDLPLFTGGRIRAEKAKADLEFKKVEQERLDLRSQVALQVKTAMTQLNSSRHEVEVANMAMKLAEEEVVQSRDRFQAGVANNIEVVSAQDALARASDNQISALYRYNQARADLAHATGQMERLYTK